MKVVVKENKYLSYMHDLDAMCIIDGFSSREEAFISDRCQLLVDQDVIQSFNLLQYNDDEYNCRIDAWGLKPAIDGSKDDSVVLIISKFFDEETLESITLSDFRSYCNKAKRFLQSTLKDDFRLRKLKYGTPESQFADYLYKRRDEDQQVTIIGITNGTINSKSNKLVISENSTSNVTFRYDVWDFPRFARIEQSSAGKESVDIDFVNDYDVPDGIKTLPVDTGSQEIKSYLFVLPGIVLYDMYEQWNERLLEQNPRTFLQFTGKINKGIRGTLTNKPDRFFSYNNGIAAVANNIDLDPVSRNITKIYNLQIVNGGQTTASIYNAYYRSKKEGKPIDIGKVFVMVKLSVIGNQELSDQIVPKISEYSNSQNKVASSAFSIRHPFHLKIEEYSRKTYAPASGDQQESLWYYERVQGQYKNALNIRHTKTEKSMFEAQNPKLQMFKSVDLAKYIMTFDMQPNVVCLGSQKCYALFSKNYLKTDEKTGEGIIGPEINQDYYKEICSKALLTKALEQRVSKGVRFVLVPYTLALVTKNLKDKGLTFNFKLIWNKQWDNEELFTSLAAYSEQVYRVIADTMPASINIFSEWGKKADCWKNVSEIQLDLFPIIEYTINLNDYLSQKKDTKNSTIIDIGINAQTYVIKKPTKYWNSLYSWIMKGNMRLTSKEIGILGEALKIPSRIPSDKQSLIIMDIEKRAIEYGFSE